MRRLATLVSSDGGALARHLGVLSAVVVVLAFRRNLSIEPGVLRLLGAGAAANFACFLAATAGRPRVRALARHVSPLVGIASWAALVRWTGGAALSPFVVALALEIVLAAMAGGWSVITAVTGAAVLALWVQELPGLDGVMLPLGLQSGFLGGTGAVAAAIRRRWGRERRDLSTRLMATERRLGAIEADLLDARRLAQLSTETAALAHSLKNAVHGLLGLARLARSRNGRVPQEEVFGALEEAIGELDGLTRRVLAPARIAPNELVAGEDLRSPLHVAVNRLEEAFPQVSCGFRFEAPPPAVVLSAEVVREVATNLLLNAAEAMEGRGEVELGAWSDESGWHLVVRDHGRGVSAGERESIFRPGFTTKKSGSGMGLYLCRRMVESQGGRLSLLPGDGDGAWFEAVFPSAREARSRWVAS